jgi:hypothetical protein
VPPAQLSGAPRPCVDWSSRSRYAPGQLTGWWPSRRLPVRNLHRWRCTKRRRRRSKLERGLHALSFARGCLQTFAKLVPFTPYRPSPQPAYAARPSTSRALARQDLRRVFGFGGQLTPIRLTILRPFQAGQSLIFAYAFRFKAQSTARREPPDNSMLEAAQCPFPHCPRLASWNRRSLPSPLWAQPAVSRLPHARAIHQKK